MKHLAFAATAVAITLAVALSAVLGAPERDVALGAGAQATSFYAVATSSRMSVSTTTASTILATSTAREYAVFVNDGYVPVYLSLGKAAAVGEGIRLSAGAGYEIRDQNLFTGAVYAVASSSGVAGPATNVTVTARQ